YLNLIRDNWYIITLPDSKKGTVVVTICLNMIVRDESHIIKKTLSNILDKIPISSWVICDTGSSDNTPKLIREFFAQRKVPGKLYHDQWIDFSHNRNLALNRCDGMSDYILFFDADDRIEGTVDTSNLTHHSYFLKMSNETHSVTYYRKLLVRNGLSFKWRGVLHEYLEDKYHDTGTINSDHFIISGRTGSRNNTCRKYHRDAEILATAYHQCKEQDLMPRYAFYCAQSYHDAAVQDEKNRSELYSRSIEWYLLRLKLSGFTEERYFSLLRIGLIHERSGRISDAIPFLLEAFEENPLRAESLYHLARIYRSLGKNNLAFRFAKMAKEIKKPIGNFLFLDNVIYDNWIDYEIMVNAIEIGLYPIAYHSARELLTFGTNPSATSKATEIINFLISRSLITVVDQDIIKKSTKNSV
ncbi:TPA: glycosyltransferase, partial [Enterobacter roggenkampii]